MSADGADEQPRTLPGRLRQPRAAAATICNQRGLHARAAARFVKTAAQFDAEVWVRKNGTEVSGRSIMGLMMLAAAPGTVIETRPRPGASRRRGDRARRA